ncbi:hypothetical protein FRC12_014283 [Ceratobasidium sp. 428]|nr:hypothetical protein FRC12_014283 [Ceratobasidium sp. 428]
MLFINRIGPSTQPPGDASTTQYLARGAAADIWMCVLGPPEKIYLLMSQTTGFPRNNFPGHMKTCGRDLLRLGPSGINPTTQEFSALVKTWSSLNHRNVVRVFGSSDAMSLEVDYYGGGCVRDYLKAHSSTVDKATMVSDVLAGMKYLHRHDPPIVHGGVNAGKLFVDHVGKVAVGEFGLTVLCYPFAAYAPSISFDGLTRWFSPELLDDDTDETPQPTLASDIWALGCTMYEILAEKLPYFEHKHEIKVQRAILAGERPGRCDDSLKNSDVGFLWPIAESCWTPAPEDRPDVLRLAQRLQNERPGSPVQGGGLIQQVQQLRLGESEIYRGYDMSGSEPPVKSDPNHQRRPEIMQATLTDVTDDVAVDTTSSTTVDISSAMPASTVITILTEHLCSEITDQLDLARCQHRSPFAYGGSGDIYRGTLKDGKEVAIKCVRLYLEDDERGRKALKRTARELYYWSRFEHKNVLELLGLAQFRDQLAMISPWMDKGTLLQYIEQNPAADRYQLCMDIAEGVAYLHQVDAALSTFVQNLWATVSDEKTNYLQARLEPEFPPLRASKLVFPSRR